LFTPLGGVVRPPPADGGTIRQGGTPMSLRTVAARAASRGPLAEAGRRLALEVARRIRIGQLTVLLPDGTRQVVGTPGGPEGELHIHETAAAWRMILNGEM